MLNWLTDRKRGLIIFLTAYAAAWALVPWLSDTTLHFDVQEEIAWGREWPLWHYRHPPMAVWLLELANRATGFASLSPYILSTASFAIGLWAISQILADTHSRSIACVAAVLTTSVYLFSLHVSLWNANTVQLAFAGLFVLGIWRALERGNTVWWLLAGAAAAGGMLSKISFITIVLPVALLVLLHPAMRSRISWPRAIAAGLVALLLIAPTYWAMWENLPAVRGQITARMGHHAPNALLGVLVTGLIVLGSAVWMMILPFLVIRFGLVGLSQGQSDAETVTRRRRALLLLTAAGPGSIVLVAAIIVVSAGSFKDHWIMANTVFLVPLLLLWSRGKQQDIRWNRFGQIMAAIWISLCLAAYPLSQYNLLAEAGPQTGSLRFVVMPPAPFVVRAEALWDIAVAGHGGLSRDVPIVAGSVDAALLANQLAGRPAWFDSFSLAKSYWIDADVLAAQGVLVAGPVPEGFARQYRLCLAGEDTVDWTNRRGVIFRVVQLSVLLPNGACG